MVRCLEETWSIIVDETILTPASTEIQGNHQGKSEPITGIGYLMRSLF